MRVATILMKIDIIIDIIIFIEIMLDQAMCSVFYKTALQPENLTASAVRVRQLKLINEK